MRLPSGSRIRGLSCAATKNRLHQQAALLPRRLYFQSDKRFAHRAELTARTVAGFNSSEVTHPLSRARGLMLRKLWTDFAPMQ